MLDKENKMTKIKISTKALAQVEGYEDVEIYDEETGEYCWDEREHYMYNADPFPLGHIVDGECSDEDFYNTDFCHIAIHPAVDKANFYFVQKYDGLFAVAELVLNIDNPTPELIEELKDRVLGQFSDGWGESFEQNPYKFEGEEYYISAYADELKPIVLQVEIFG